MTYLILAAGYAPVIGLMYFYADTQYYLGRQDERVDLLSENRKE